MHELQFIRSTTFRWAAAVAAVLAVFVVLLFGFAYRKIDRYLIERSNLMVTTQLNFIAAMPVERQVDAVEDHLGGDSRNVQFAGLFASDGRRLAGNIESLP